MGTKEGVFEKFDKDGNKLSSYLYSEGERHGEFTEIEDDYYKGLIKTVGKQNMGKLDGEINSYNQNKILKKIMYDNGVIKFEENYDKNGKVIK